MPVSEDLVQRALDTGLIDEVEAERMRLGLPSPCDDPTWPTLTCPTCAGRGLVAIDYAHRRVVPAPDGPAPAIMFRRPAPKAAPVGTRDPMPDPPVTLEERSSLDADEGPDDREVTA